MCGKNEAIAIMNQVCEACNRAFEQKIQDAYLYGSYARGDAKDNSDIDLLLDRTGLQKGWAIGGLYADLADALGKELDMVTTTGVDRDFLRRIQQDAVSLYQRSPDQAV